MCQIFLAIHGFMKTAFVRKEFLKDGDSNFGLCSITDGEYKLEVKLFNFTNLNAFKKGYPVSMKGYLKISSMCNLKVQIFLFITIKKSFQI